MLWFPTGANGMMGPQTVLALREDYKVVVTDIASPEDKDQVIPTPSHLLGRISPIFTPFFPVFCAFSPSRRGGSNEPNRNPGPRNSVKGAQTPFRRPS